MDATISRHTWTQTHTRTRTLNIVLPQSWQERATTRTTIHLLPDDRSHMVLIVGSEE
jgi:hypothetical protein